MCALDEWNEKCAQSCGVTIRRHLLAGLAPDPMQKLELERIEDVLIGNVMEITSRNLLQISKELTPGITQNMQQEREAELNRA